MTQAQQDLISLKSGIWGPDVNLQGLVQEGWVSQEGADLYLEELGSSGRVVLNENGVSDEPARARL